MEDIKSAYKKYSDKLKNVNLSLNIQLKQEKLSEENKSMLHLNYFNLLNDLIDEIIKDNNTKGTRINLLSDITNEKNTSLALRFISSRLKTAVFENTDLRKFNIKIFNAMLDAYTSSERDITCFNNLLNMMQKSIFLKKISNSDFILTYPELLKDIYSDNLENALTSICENLAETNQTIETNFILANLLTYVSAALELPDVYVYSKKMLLEFSMIKHDYFKASEVITDLEDMNYINTDLKYYKALIRQKQPNNILKYMKSL